MKRLNTGYKTLSLIADVNIQYGKENFTTFNFSEKIQIVSDKTPEFFYFHNNPEIEMKFSNGFIEQNKDFKKLREFNSWSTKKDEKNENRSFILQSLKSFKKNEITILQYDLRTKLGYLERQDGVTDLYHFNGINIKSPTNKIVITFNIPRGEISYQKYFKLHLKQNNKITSFRIIKAEELDFKRLNSKTIIFAKRGTETNSINIISEDNFNKGDTIKLEWFTREYGY